MFKEPWFRIIDVQDAHGPSMADIVLQIAGEARVTLDEIRGAQQSPRIRKARTKAMSEVHRIRPDLPSTVVARFFRRDSSTIRYSWKRSAA